VFPIYDDNPFNLPVRPVVTWSLIAANFLIFAIGLTGGEDSMQAFGSAFGLTPGALIGDSPAHGVAPPVTLLTYMFVHAGWAHIIGNMLFLEVFGDDVEEALGRIRFLLFYLLCGVVGGLVFVATDPGFQGPLVGASGAISGVVIGYMMFRPCAKVTLLFGFLPLRVRAFWVIGAFILAQLWNLDATGKSQVAYWCHLGGMLTGAALFPLMRLPGVQLFECVEHPHYPGDPVAAVGVERDPRS